MFQPDSYTVADFCELANKGYLSHAKIIFNDSNNTTIEDNDIYAAGISISKYMNSDTDLTFGKSSMTEVVIPIFKNKVAARNIKWNDSFVLKFGYDDPDNNTTAWVKVGVFRGTRPEASISEDIIYFYAYDNMQLFEANADEFIAEYNEGYSDQIVFAFLSILCNRLNVHLYTEYDPDLQRLTVPDAIQVTLERPVPRNCFASGLTYRQIVEAIAEALGCYAVMNADGYLEMKWFKQAYVEPGVPFTVTEKTIFPPINTMEQFDGIKWKDLETKTWEDLETYKWKDFLPSGELYKIDAFKITNGENDIGTYYPYASNGNVYEIKNNPILAIMQESDVETYIKPLYDRVRSLVSYIPISFTCVGNPLIDTGDIICVVIGTNTRYVPIFNKTTQWNGAFRDSYETTGNLKREASTAVGTQNMQEVKGYGKAHRYINDLNEFYSEIENVDDKTIIHQTEDDLILQGNTNYIKFHNGKLLALTDDNSLTINEDGLPSYFAKWKFMNQYQNAYIAMIDTDHNFAYGIGDDPGIREGGNYPEENISTLTFGMDTNNEPNIYLGHLLINGYTNILFRMLYKIDIVDYGLQTVFYPTLKPCADDYASAAYVSYRIGDSSHKWDEGYFGYLSANTIDQPSSKEVKKNIKDIKKQGDIIDKLRPVTFVYKDDATNRKRYGLIYEEAIDVMPEICSSGLHPKSVNYIDLIPILLKEIQDLRDRVAKLEGR